MQVLFGKSHDYPHNPPSTPSGYEWWYFDALSADDCSAIVVIFFAGAPMTPYYRRVLKQCGDTADQWSGVFITVHRRKSPTERWRQRFYAFNFANSAIISDDGTRVQIGSSQFVREGDVWHLSLREKAIWQGEIQMEMTFTDAAPLHEGFSTNASDDPHGWACIAPHCAVQAHGRCGETVVLVGDGYHDHNWGRLPYEDMEIWYWCRAHLRCSDGVLRTMILYALFQNDVATQTEWIVIEADGQVQRDSAAAVRKNEEKTRIYGLHHASSLLLMAEGTSAKIELMTANSFANGPFYRRMPVQCTVQSEKWSASGIGIGEVFRPARLAGGLVSLATRARFRRR